MKKRFTKHSISRSIYCFLGVLFIGLSSFSASAQQKQVSGTVTSSDGIPLPGVNVLQKGTSNGTVSDFDGNYAINLGQGSETLVFSYLGYKTLELSVSGKSTLNVTLEESAEGLDEVVIVGYGTTKKVNLTGAVGLIKGEVLENRPIATVGQGLQGVLPGLNITVQNGDPSQNVDFNIRGFESINGGSPLILVDNVPMDLNQINPNDIESISVLKDAASAAIYGARAAFGVVLVTTKKGKKGKMTVSLSTEQTVSSPIFLIDAVDDPYVYMTNQNYLAELEGGSKQFDDDRLAAALAYSQNPTVANAWRVVGDKLEYNGANKYQDKVITDQSFQKKYDLSVSGSSEDASYYASAGYFGKKGFLVNDDKNQNFERFNALLKAEFKVTKWLSLDSKIIYTNTTNNNPHTYAFDASINSVARAEPIMPLEFPDLEFYLTPGDRADYEQYIGKAFDNNNTIPYINEGSRDQWTKHDTWFTQGLTITPVEGLVVKSDFSYNTFFQSVENVAAKISVVNGFDLNNLAFSDGYSSQDYVLNRTQYNQYFAFNMFAEYTYDKFENHFFKGMVGYNQEELRTRRLQGRGNSLITPGIQDINATTGDQFAEGGRSQYALRGAFFRFNYNYQGKYLLEVNGRYDGTSRFPKDDRFGFFPSFSAGWRVSEESFMSGTSNWLSNLKFRASYGELGNQIYTENGQQNYYPYVPSLSSNTSDHIFGSGMTPYVSAAGLVSPTLTWESVTTRNFGLDASLLKGKLDLSADVYVRATKDMLLRAQLPDVLGATEPLENGADLETKGWELALNWRDKIGENMKYSLGFNLSDNQSKITKYEGENPNINGLYEGKNLGEIWGFETVGFFESADDVANSPSQNKVDGGTWEEGDIKYADLDGSGEIDTGTNRLDDHGDLKVIGNTTARYTFGVTPHIEYKGLSLDMFFQGLFRDFDPPKTPHASFWPYNGTLVTKNFISDSWSENNRDAYFARPRGENRKNIQTQTRYLQDAAYIRLKNVTLNYNFDEDLVSSLGLSRAAIYLSGQNLWESSGIYKTLDPEQNYSDSLNQQYYFERTFSLGLKVTF